MPTALLRNANLSQDRIDSAEGIIYGVRIAEVGKLAKFKNGAGKVTQFDVSSEHIDALLAHAGSRTLPVHWTHDYGDGKDPLHAKVGAIKNLRKDSEGNLIADLAVAPSEYRDQIFWNAQNDPTGMMMSAVFGYAKDDPKCMPKSFEAADLVETGAATTALLSAKLSDTSMDDDLISQLAEACKDPHKMAAFKALMKSVGAEADAQAEMSDEDASAMMSAAGVIDADKKDDDKDKPLVVRAMLATSRSVQRQIAELKNAKTEIIEQAKLAAAAVVNKSVGKNGVVHIGGDKGEQDAEAFITAQLANGCPNRATAIARMAKDNKELYATFRS